MDKLFLECACGCSAIQISSLEWKDSEPDYFISIWEPCFMSYQGNLFSVLWKRLKIIKDILFKGEYFLHEIMVKEKDMIRLKDYLDNILESK